MLFGTRDVLVRQFGSKGVDFLEETPFGFGLDVFKTVVVDDARVFDRVSPDIALVAIGNLVKGQTLDGGFAFNEVNKGR